MGRWPYYYDPHLRETGVSVRVGERVGHVMDSQSLLEYRKRPGAIENLVS